MGRTAQRELQLPRGSDKPKDAKRRLIMAVRAACRAQGIGDDDRKALQAELTGKASLADMTFGEMGKVLDHLNRDRARPAADRPHIAKIRALWWSLYWLGAIDDAGERAIDAFVQRQTGIASLRFLDAKHEHSVVEALKSWLTREGVVWPRPETVRDALARMPEATADKHDRYAVATAIGLKLERKGRVLAWYEYARKSLQLGLNHWCWTGVEWDAVIRLLGAMRRQTLGKDSAQ